METIVAVLVLVAVFVLLRWLFPGRPGEEVRSRPVAVSRAGDTEWLTITEVVPSPAQPPADATPIVTAPVHDAAPAGHSHHSHHAHDPGQSHHDPGHGGGFDGGGAHH